MKDILKSNKLPVVDYLSFTRNDLKEKYMKRDIERSMKDY